MVTGQEWESAAPAEHTAACEPKVSRSEDMWTLILVTVIFSGSVAGGVAGNTAFLDFPSEAKCRAAASVMEASERVAISATRPGQTNISPPAYYRIIARCIER
jgi:hypothetical protein